jgi:hypothetical protein
MIAKHNNFDMRYGDFIKYYDNVMKSKIVKAPTKQEYYTIQEYYDRFKT